MENRLGGMDRDVFFCAAARVCVPHSLSFHVILASVDNGKRRFAQVTKRTLSVASHWLHPVII